MRAAGDEANMRKTSSSNYSGRIQQWRNEHNHVVIDLEQSFYEGGSMGEPKILFGVSLHNGKEVMTLDQLKELYGAIFEAIVTVEEWNTP